MSQSIFNEYVKSKNDLTVPFPNQNFNLTMNDTYSRKSGKYPKGLDFKTTAGTLQSSNIQQRDGLPFSSSAKILLSDELKEPGISNVGLVWAIDDDLSISQAVLEPLESNTEMLMKQNTYPDGILKGFIPQQDPEYKNKQAYANFTSAIQRAVILAQNDRYAEDASSLTLSAWEMLRRTAPEVYKQEMSKLHAATTRASMPALEKEENKREVLIKDDDHPTYKVTAKGQVKISHGNKFNDDLEIGEKKESAAREERKNLLNEIQSAKKPKEKQPPNYNYDDEYKKWAMEIDNTVDPQVLYGYIMATKASTPYYNTFMNLDSLPFIKNRKNIAEMAYAITDEIGGKYDGNLFEEKLNILLNNLDENTYKEIAKKKTKDERILEFKNILKQAPKSTVQKTLDLATQIAKTMKNRRKQIKDESDDESFQ